MATSHRSTHDYCIINSGMGILYYLAIFVLILGLPSLLILLAALIYRPQLLERATGKMWSRKKLFGIGSGILTGFFMIMCSVVAVTMPADERAAMEARQQAADQADSQSVSSSNSPIKKIETTSSTIPYTSSDHEDPSLEKGARKITTPGQNGEKLDTYEVIYVNGKQTDKTLTKSTVTKEPVAEIVSIGTYSPTPAAPQTLYDASPSSPPPSASQGAYYANCSDARAAGVAPLYAGQPGYRSALDRDKDGIACE